MIDVSAFPNIRKTDMDALKTDEFFSPVLDSLATLLENNQCIPQASFDLLDYAEIADRICLVDVEREPQRLKFRLIGSRIVSLYGIDNTGKYFDDLQDELGDQYAENDTLFRYIAECRSWVRHGSTFEWVDRGHIRVESLSCAVCDEAGEVVQLLIVVVFDQ